MTPQQQIQEILTNINSIVDRYSLEKDPIDSLTAAALDYDGFALLLTKHDYHFSYGRESSQQIILPNVDPRQPRYQFKAALIHALQQLQSQLS